MKYQDYNLEDFLNDNYFVEWINNPSPECNYFWKNWLSKHPEKSEVIGLAKEIITSIDYQNHHNPSHSEKLEVLEKIIKNSKGDNPPFFKWSIKLAASILVAIGIFFWVSSANKTAQSTAMAESIVKSTAFGEKKTIMLPDGSEVKLNYGSEIEYTSDFMGNSREVTLIGEAFFNVKSNAEKPFIITTQNVKTIVLGTSFDVKAYSDEEEIKVIVATGKVRVQNHDENGSTEDVILRPNEMVSMNKVTGRLVKEKCDIGRYIDWKDGKITFYKSTFEEVIDELEKWYGVDIHVADGLNIPGRFNGSFQNYGMENVLKGLSFSHQIDFELKGKTVTITNKHYEKN